MDPADNSKSDDLGEEEEENEKGPCLLSLFKLRAGLLVLADLQPFVKGNLTFPFNLNYFASEPLLSNSRCLKP